MSQPPLSRAIKQLESDVGATLFQRSATGVVLTAAGAVLLDDARRLLEQADQVRVRVAAAAGPATITIGILGDSTDEGANRLAAEFRREHPDVEVRIRDTDLTDPTCGLRAGLVDVALTRAPFELSGLTTYDLRSDPLGVVLRNDDPLVERDRLELADLADRSWFRFPEGTDATWQSYWSGGVPRQGPVVRTVQECLQAVLWNGTIGLAPLRHEPSSPGLTVVPLHDIAPSRVVVAWKKSDPNPLIPSLVRIAHTAYAG